MVPALAVPAAARVEPAVLAVWVLVQALVPAVTVKAVVVTIITSVLGGLAAFLAAYFFQALVFSFMAPDMAAQFHDLTSRFQDQTLALTVIGAVTPVPYTLVAIVAGFMKGNALVFVLASLVGRGIRYGVAGYVIYLFGPQAVAQVRKNLFIVSILTVLATAVYLFYRW